MDTCYGCEKPIEGQPITGYLAPGTKFCKPCYDYMENEVFAYKGEDDASSEPKN